MYVAVSVYDPIGRAPDTLQVLTPEPLALRVHVTVAPSPLTFQVTVPVGEVAEPALVSLTVTVDVTGVP